MSKTYTNLETLLPGAAIGRFAHSPFAYVWIYDKNTRSHIKRSTDIKDVDQAKAWIFSNLATLLYYILNILYPNSLDKMIKVPRVKGIKVLYRSNL